MKFILYAVIILVIYRFFFSPKIVIEHKHFYDKKNKDDKKRPDAELTDYEEIK